MKLLLSQGSKRQGPEVILAPANCSGIELNLLEELVFRCQDKEKEEKARLLDIIRCYGLFIINDFLLITK